MNIGRILIISGSVLLILGLVITFIEPKLKWFGNLPLDFKFKGNSTQLYAPFGSMIVLSLILSLIANIFFRIFK